MNYTNNSVDELQQTDEGKREFAKEELAYSATELIAELMDSEGVSKAELATRIGKSKAHVTQILSGSRNMTMHTLAEFTFALGYTVKLRGVSNNRCQMIGLRKLKDADLKFASHSALPESNPTIILAA